MLTIKRFAVIFVALFAALVAVVGHAQLTNTNISYGGGAPGTVTTTGTAVANQCTYWTGPFSIAGDPGCTYVAATDTMTVGNLIVNDATTLGNAVGDTATSNAGVWSFPNDTTVALGGGVNGINFDTNTLSIDATNNRVGINTAAPNVPLHVVGTTDSNTIVMLGFSDRNNIVYGGISNPNVGNTAAAQLYAYTGSNNIEIDIGCYGSGWTNAMFGPTTHQGDCGIVTPPSTPADIFIQPSTNNVLQFWAHDGTQRQAYEMQSDGESIFFQDVGINDAAPGAYLTVTGGTLPDTSNRLANFTATFPAVITGTRNAMQFSATSAGASAFTQSTLFVNLGAGYTGASNSNGIIVNNAAAGTGVYDPRTSSDVSSAQHNAGVKSFAFGSGTGTNIGLTGIGALGALSIGTAGICEGGLGYRQDSTNIGVAGSVVGAKNGASTTEKHIGVEGHALNGDTNVAGYFGLQAAVPTYVSAALIADNGAVAAPVQVWRDNGTEVARVDNGGNVGIGNPSPSNPLDITKNQTGNSYVRISNTTADGLSGFAAINNSSGGVSFRAIGSADLSTGFAGYGMLRSDSTLNGFVLNAGGAGAQHIILATTDIERWRVINSGIIQPGADNTYDIGTAALRVKTLHLGPASLVVHNDATDTSKLTVDYSGANAARIHSTSTDTIRVVVGGGTTNGVVVTTDNDLTLRCATNPCFLKPLSSTGVDFGGIASDNTSALHIRISGTGSTAAEVPMTWTSSATAVRSATFSIESPLTDHNFSVSTTGTRYTGRYISGVTQTGALVGHSLDFNTNLTTAAAATAVTGHTITMPTGSFTSGIATWTGYSVTGNAITTNPGTMNWRGFSVGMPNATETTGSINSHGVFVAAPATTVGNMLQSGLTVTGPGAIPSGSFYGIEIRDATGGGAGEEHGIDIGSNWDFGIQTSSPVNVLNTLSNGTCTLNGLLTASCTATTFTGAICTCNDTQPATNGIGTLTCAVSGTTLTITSNVISDGSIVSYHCF